MKRISRRNFLKAMGISATALTLAACVFRRPGCPPCCQCSSNR